MRRTTLSSLLLLTIVAALFRRRRRPEKPVALQDRGSSISGFVLSGTLVATSLAALASAWSAVEANRQANAALEGNRAWLRLSMVPAEMKSMAISNLPGSYVLTSTPHFSAKNIGKTPATRASAYFIGMSNVGDGVEAEKRVCSSIKDDEYDKRVVFPDDEITEKVGPGSYAISFNTVELQKEKLNPTAFSIYLVGCAIYRFNGSNVLHHTGVIYQAWRRLSPTNITSSFDVSLGSADSDIYFFESHSSGQLID